VTGITPAAFPGRYEAAIGPAAVSPRPPPPAYTLGAMDSIFRGDLLSRRGRALAWADSLLVDHGLLRLVWTNFAPVVPGRLYRTNHPTPARLAAIARRHGIRTVINLRGPCGNGSDALSRAAASRLGLGFVDAPVSSGHPPRRDQALALADALARSPQPILVHCKSGADRAGIAAAMFLILHGEPVARAALQLSWRHGHWPKSRAGILDAFLRRYAREAEGRKSFMDWLREDYDEASLRAEFRAARLSDFVSHRLLRRE
jgi:protein tyrosine/serine phosphatase